MRSPTNRRASVHPGGAAVSAGWYGAEPSRETANTSAIWYQGSWATFTIASNVSAGRVPSGEVAASKSASQSARLSKQAKTALASESNVSRVRVSPPLGVVSSTEDRSPVSTSARLWAIDAALGRPGDGPLISLPSVNWAMA